MLLFVPPTGNADNVQYCRIRGEHFIVISNYNGQVAEIRRALREQANLTPSIKDEDIATINARMGTTRAQQGKEGDITIYSPCIGTGDVRLSKKDHLGLGFVASVKNFNVSMTRQRVARYIVGSFKLYAQALKDNHAIVHRNSEFFAHIRSLFQKEYIISSEEMAIWRDTGVPPQPADNFRFKLLDPPFNPHKPDYKQARAKEVPAPSTTAPAAAKKKKSGSKGVKHRLKRQKEREDNEASSAATSP
jgi:hypothetical protein